jgi:hypothetical protein
MITTKMLNCIKDFESVKKGDILAVEWNRDSFKGNKKTRFACYEVFENHHNDGVYNRSEIILQKQNNVYFNFEMFCSDNGSNAKTVMQVKSE